MNQIFQNDGSVHFLNVFFRNCLPTLKELRENEGIPEKHFYLLCREIQAPAVPILPLKGLGHFCPPGNKALWSDYFRPPRSVLPGNTGGSEKHTFIRFFPEVRAARKNTLSGVPGVLGNAGQQTDWASGVAESLIRIRSI